MSNASPLMTPEVEEQTQTVSAPKEPSMYLVHILNDDFTPYEFVIGLLIGVFNHDFRTAETLAHTTHTQGQALVGRYTMEVAETRVETATRLAHSEGFPLTFRVEPEPAPRPGVRGP